MAQQEVYLAAIHYRQAQIKFAIQEKAMPSPQPSPSPSQQIAAMLAEVRQMQRQADELQAALAELVRSSSPSSPIAAVQPQPTTPQGEAKNGTV